MPHHPDSQHPSTIGRTEVAGSKVRTPLPDYLSRVIREACVDNEGANADYIPELRDADPNKIGLALSTVDGYIYCSGDANYEFSIQSISKAFVYALALEEHGVDYVLGRIGVEPSGEAFNELSLEKGTCRPLNPMINAGAIVCHTLIGSEDMDEGERFERIRQGLSDFAGRELGFDNEVFTSEMKTAYRNMAIANMLRNYNVIKQNPELVVTGYTRQCAIKVTARDLAHMASTLANGGIQPVTGKRVVSQQVVRQVLSVMMTCGMYDGAGDWVTTIGFPAKSGVAGGIMGALPGQVGIATFSPRLDQHGTSVRGVRMCKKLSDDMGLHIMNAPEPARAAIRRDYLLSTPSDHELHPHTAAVVSLQGSINFTSAERILRLIAARSSARIKADGLVLDIRRVYSMDSVSRRMLREIIRRIRAAGFRVALIDPERRLDMHTVDTPGADPDMVCDHVLDDLTHFDSWKRESLPQELKIES